MGYWTLTYDCLVQLKNNWDRYYNDRADAIRYLAERAEEDFRKEGNDDLYYNRYSSRSIHEWYDGKVREITNWVDKCMNDLNREDERFQELWKRAYNDYYTRDVYSHLVTYDFYRFEKRVEYDPSVNPNSVKVKFAGQTHWYKYNDRRRDLELTSTKPSFEWHD